MTRFSLVFLFVIFSGLGWAEEPNPEEYIPEWVEIREVVPAGVLSDWWQRANRALIWHVTPAFEEIPSATDYEPFEVIRSSTSGFWVRGVTPEWKEFPGSLGAVMFGATEIVSVTQTTNVFNSIIINTTNIYSVTATTNIIHATTIVAVSATTNISNSTTVNAITINSVSATTNIFHATTVVVNRLVTDRYEQTYAGDQSQVAIALDYPAYGEGFEIYVVTDPPIGHVVEWLAGVNYEQTLDGQGRIVSVQPLDWYKWYLQTTIRMRYVRADE